MHPGTVLFQLDVEGVQCHVVRQAREQRALPFVSVDLPRAALHERPLHFASHRLSRDKALGRLDINDVTVAIERVRLGGKLLRVGLQGLDERLLSRPRLLFTERNAFGDRHFGPTRGQMPTVRVEDDRTQRLRRACVEFLERAALSLVGCDARTRDRAGRFLKLPSRDVRFLRAKTRQQLRGKLARERSRRGECAHHSRLVLLHERRRRRRRRRRRVEYVNQLLAAEEHRRKDDEQRHRRRHGDRDLLDEADLARNDQLAQIEHLIDRMELRTVAERREFEPRLRTGVLDRFALVGERVKRDRLVKRDGAALHQHQMHEFIVLDEDKHGGPAPDALKRRDARGGGIQLAALALHWLKLAEADDGLALRLELGVVRRAGLLDVMPALGAGTLGGVGAPVQPEYELRALFSRYGFEVHRHAYLALTSTGRRLPSA